MDVYVLFWIYFGVSEFAREILGQSVSSTYISLASSQDGHNTSMADTYTIGTSKQPFHTSNISSQTTVISSSTLRVGMTMATEEHYSKTVAESADYEAGHSIESVHLWSTFSDYSSHRSGIVSDVSSFTTTYDSLLSTNPNTKVYSTLKIKESIDRMTQSALISEHTDASSGNDIRPTATSNYLPSITTNTLTTLRDNPEYFTIHTDSLTGSYIETKSVELDMTALVSPSFQEQSSYDNAPPRFSTAMDTTNAFLPSEMAGRSLTLEIIGTRHEHSSSYDSETRNTEKRSTMSSASGYSNSPSQFASISTNSLNLPMSALSLTVPSFESVTSSFVTSYQEYTSSYIPIAVVASSSLILTDGIVATSSNDMTTTTSKQIEDESSVYVTRFSDLQDSEYFPPMTYMPYLTLLSSELVIQSMNPVDSKTAPPSMMLQDLSIGSDLPTSLLVDSPSSIKSSNLFSVSSPFSSLVELSTAYAGGTLVNVSSLEMSTQVPEQPSISQTNIFPETIVTVELELPSSNSLSMQSFSTVLTTKPFYTTTAETIASTLPVIMKPTATSEIMSDLVTESMESIGSQVTMSFGLSEYGITSSFFQTGLPVPDTTTLPISISIMNPSSTLPSSYSSNVGSRPSLQDSYLSEKTSFTQLSSVVTRVSGESIFLSGVGVTSAAMVTTSSEFSDMLTSNTTSRYTDMLLLSSSHIASSIVMETGPPFTDVSLVESSIVASTGSDGFIESSDSQNYINHTESQSFQTISTTDTLTATNLNPSMVATSFIPSVSSMGSHEKPSFSYTEISPTTTIFHTFPSSSVPQILNTVSRSVSLGDGFDSLRITGTSTMSNSLYTSSSLYLQAVDSTLDIMSGMSSASFTNTNTSSMGSHEKPSFSYTEISPTTTISHTFPSNSVPQILNTVSRSVSLGDGSESLRITGTSTMSNSLYTSSSLYLQSADSKLDIMSGMSSASFTNTMDMSRVSLTTSPVMLSVSTATRSEMSSASFDITHEISSAASVITQEMSSVSFATTPEIPSFLSATTPEVQSVSFASTSGLSIVSFSDLPEMSSGSSLAITQEISSVSFLKTHEMLSATYPKSSEMSSVSILNTPAMPSVSNSSTLEMSSVSVTRTLGLFGSSESFTANFVPSTSIISTISSFPSTIQVDETFTKSTTISPNTPLVSDNVVSSNSFTYISALLATSREISTEITPTMKSTLHSTLHLPSPLFTLDTMTAVMLVPTVFMSSSKGVSSSLSSNTFVDYSTETFIPTLSSKETISTKSFSVTIVSFTTHHFTVNSTESLSLSISRSYPPGFSETSMLINASSTLLHSAFLSISSNTILPSTAISISPSTSSLETASFTTSTAMPSSTTPGSPDVTSGPTQPQTTPNITVSGENLWVKTVIMARLNTNISSASFRTDLEGRLAVAYDEAFRRERLIQLGLFDKIRRKRYSESGDTAVHIHDITRVGDSTSVNVLYAVEKSGTILTPEEASTSLNTLDTQELAIILRQVVQTVAEPYQSSSRPVDPENSGIPLWLVGVIAASVAAVIMAAWLAVCIYIKCCREKEKRGEPELMSIQQNERPHGSGRSHTDSAGMGTSAQSDQPRQTSKNNVKKFTPYQMKPADKEALVENATERETSSYENEVMTQSPYPDIQHSSKAKSATRLDDRASNHSLSYKPDLEPPTPTKKGTKMASKSNNGDRYFPAVVYTDDHVSPSKLKLNKYQVLQSSFSDQDNEDLRERTRLERLKNKERIRIKKRNQRPQVHDPSNSLYNVMGMPSTPVPSLQIESGRPLQDDSNHTILAKDLTSLPNACAPGEESLEEARTRMHRLLDDAFTLISPRSSFAPESVPSLQNRSNMSTASMDKGNNSKEAKPKYLAEPSDSGEPKESGYENPGYSHSGLETWSPYRTSDLVAMISMPTKQEPTRLGQKPKSVARPISSTKPNRRPAASFEFKETKSATMLDDSRLTTSPARPIQLRTGDRSESGTRLTNGHSQHGRATVMVSPLPKVNTNEQFEMNSLKTSRHGSAPRNRTVPGLEGRTEDVQGTATDVHPSSGSFIQNLRDELSDLKDMYNVPPVHAHRKKNRKHSEAV